MKTYVNLEGKTSHFIGPVPEGWREMTAEETQQNEQEKQKQQTLEEWRQKKIEKLIDKDILADATVPQEIKDLISG